MRAHTMSLPSGGRNRLDPDATLSLHAYGRTRSAVANPRPRTGSRGFGPTATCRRDRFSDIPKILEGHRCCPTERALSCGQRRHIDAFSAPNGSFDAVLGLSILHLLDDRRTAIAKVHRMLALGGVFLSSTRASATP